MVDGLMDGELCLAGRMVGESGKLGSLGVRRYMIELEENWRV